MAKRQNKHEMRKLRLQRKRDQKKQDSEDKVKTDKKNKTFLYLGGALILIVIVYGVMFVVSNKGNEVFSDDGTIYSENPIHWHADLEISLCGVNKDLPRAPAASGMLGPHILHTHDDNKIHIEGLVRSSGEITLGRFLDGINVEFSNESIFKYKNGNMCDDEKENIVKLFVNEIENHDFREYVLKNADMIRIEYN